MLRAMPLAPRLVWLLPLALAGCGGGGEMTPSGPPVPVKVMTRNLYLGADLIPVVTAMTLEEIPMKVAALYKTMKASDIPGRAKLLADEIATAQPDLVGLQEAVIFYKQVPSDFSFANPAVNADKVEYDFVQLLLDELTARGTEYVSAVIAKNSDVEFPAADEGQTFDVRMTDRDVILARKGTRVETANPTSTLYPTHLKFSIPFGSTTGVPVDLVRGLGRVDATVAGARFTFVNTHLEVGGGGNNEQARALLAPLQEGQARDLLNLLKPVSGPVVLVGDFNSPADRSGTMSYSTVAGGFTDAYAKLFPGMPGFTCCTDIAAPATMPTQRIDIVFFRGGATAQTIEQVGVDPAKRTPVGLWPSDHAGLVATLQVPGPPAATTTTKP
jgi:endonuclease/exonuclease/phosphatase family metal-dependent hydrolase